LIRGLYTAASGMVLNNRQSSTIKQNIENIFTPGYRMESEKITSFPRMLVHRLSPSSSETNSVENTPLGIMGTGVYSPQTFYSVEMGKLRETCGNTDLALNSPGYFVVETLQGERYTRNGHFELDASGMLRTAGGNLVLGENGPLGPLSPNFRVREDGTVANIEITTVDNEDGTTREVETEVVVDKLRIVLIPPEDLERDGLTSLFRAANQPLPAPQGDIAVIQGFVEESNVDLNAQMVKMLEVMRSYAANQKVIQTGDNLMQKAANEIGKV